MYTKTHFLQVLILKVLILERFRTVRDITVIVVVVVSTGRLDWLSVSLKVFFPEEALANQPTEPDIYSTGGETKTAINFGVLLFFLSRKEDHVFLLQKISCIPSGVGRSVEAFSHGF